MGSFNRPTFTKSMFAQTVIGWAMMLRTHISLIPMASTNAFELSSLSLSLSRMCLPFHRPAILSRCPSGKWCGPCGWEPETHACVPDEYDWDRWFLLLLLSVRCWPQLQLNHLVEPLSWTGLYFCTNSPQLQLQSKLCKNIIWWKSYSMLGLA